MKKISHARKVLAGIACFGLLLVFMSQAAFSQGFINREDRPRWGDRYENFSNYDLRRYPRTLVRKQGKREGNIEWVNPVWHGPADPVSFDQFGNFLLPGGDIYNLTWDKSPAGASQVYGANAANIFNNLMISSDEFSNWQTKFMIGTNLRAYFTPSTLKRTNFNGVRWDASSRKNSFTFLASVGGTNLFGAYWQSILGDVLKLGGTFVTRQRGTQSYSNHDIDSGLNGLHEKDMPRYVYVLVTDDSPEDERNGARVYDIKAMVNGKEADLPMRSFTLSNVLRQRKFSDGKWQEEYQFRNYYRTKAEYQAYIPENVEDIQYSSGSWILGLLNAAALRQFFEKGPKGVLGYVNIYDPENPEDSAGRQFKADFSQGYVDVYGTDVLIYEYLVPAGARSLSFNVLCANDYCLDIVAALPSRKQDEVPSWDTQPGTEAWSGNWSPIYDKRHCKKAPGNVGDFSNTGWVKIEYNRLTGINAYGLNMELNWRGLFVRAEINEYNAKWSYPIHEYMKGEKNEDTNARAWFVNFEKDFGKWSFGGEVFNYPNEYMQYWAPIDDNDDNNRYTGGGEYPGMNVDWDRAPGNQHIDTYFSGQPYLTYYFDSISFGDDFNHNGIIDERENDTSADLPYDRDSKGQHYFLKLKPRDLSLLSLGHYDINQEYQKGRNLTDYVKAEHMQRLSSFFEYGLFHRTQRVKDNYKSNKWYSQYWGPSGRFNNLAYNDSWVNSSMVKTLITPIANLNIINSFSYNSVHRLGEMVTIEGSTMQETLKAPRDIISATSIHKIDYTFRLADFRLLPDIVWRGVRLMREKRIKEFRIQPQFKYVSGHYTADLQYRNNGGHSYNYYPILRFDYKVAPKTDLRFAMQGFPGFMEKRRNSGDRLHDEDRRRMFFGFETRTLYQGFNLLVTTGMRRDKRQWVESHGRKEIGNTVYSIEIRCEAAR